MQMDVPRITFGMIVLNGEPFIRYNLRALYPWAHQIIVVEGACPAARGVATEDGHSLDDTLTTLRQFQAEEDPEGKLIIVTAEDAGHPDGFWPGEKDEMSQAYAGRATGNYLWQIDVDEFYKTDDMRQIIAMLTANPSISMVSFRQCAFWGGFAFTVEGYWYLHFSCRRIFKWGPHYVYRAHRPPAVYDHLGRDLAEMPGITVDELADSDIRMYHYQTVFPQQVTQKADYYSHVDWTNFSLCNTWARESYGHLRWPFHVDREYHTYSWLKRFTGTHPEAIEALKADLVSGRLDIAQRPTDDIERLTSSVLYHWGIALLLFIEPYPAISRRLDRIISLCTDPKAFFGKLRGKYHQLLRHDT